MRKTRYGIKKAMDLIGAEVFTDTPTRMVFQRGLAVTFVKEGDVWCVCSHEMRDWEFKHLGICRHLKVFSHLFERGVANRPDQAWLLSVWPFWTLRDSKVAIVGEFETFVPAAFKIPVGRFKRGDPTWKSHRVGLRLIDPFSIRLYYDITVTPEHPTGSRLKHLWNVLFDHIQDLNQALLKLS